MSLDNFYKKDEIRTGDVLLFSGNTPTGFLLRFFTSSVWNHVGIAIRLKDNEITLDNTGDIYVLETNTGIRKDYRNGKYIRGLGFSKLDFSIKNYNRVSVRKLKEKYRDENLKKVTEIFYEKNKISEYPTETLPFINVWLGMKIWDITSKNKFCSHLTVEYYQEILNNLKLNEFNNSICGNECLENELIIPEHFSYHLSPNSQIFENKLEKDIYIQESDVFYIIIQPLIILFVVIVIFFMILELV